jgi:hypothetical protein
MYDKAKYEGYLIKHYKLLIAPIVTKNTPHSAYFIIQFCSHMKTTTSVVSQSSLFITEMQTCCAKS